ncbi:MAG: GNVR domain-containing protein [Paracoccaceae bacterium]
MNLDLKFYLAIFLRRIHYFVIVTALVSAASIAAALLLPSVYQASSMLLVENSQIPGALAAPTVQAAALEKLQTMQNKLMTRANLLDIANRLKVFRNMNEMTPDDIVQAMRDGTNIQNNAAKGQATFMNISFNGMTGKIAAGVVNEYVTLILKADVDSRTKNAEDTVNFFDQEVTTLSAQLDQLSAKLLDFQNKNANALPSNLAFRQAQMSSLQGKLDATDQSIKALQDQKAQVIATYNSTGQVASNNANQTPEAKQLATLNDQLNQSLAVMSPNHPKVKMLQAQITQLEQIVKTQAAATATGSTNPAASMFEVQIADFDARIKAATETRDQLQKQIDDLQITIDKTPSNQVALDALNRDYQNVQGQYNAAIQRQSQASAGERIELLSKGERVTVVDSATIPDSPIKPRRAKIALLGIAAGMFLGLASIAVTELLNRSVRRPRDIVKAFGITPIVTIPYVRTPSETMKRRSAFVVMLLVAVIGIPAAMYAVHVFYQPLDVLLNRVTTKFGFTI